MTVFRGVTRVSQLLGAEQRVLPMWSQKSQKPCGSTHSIAGLLAMGVRILAVAKSVGQGCHAELWTHPQG